METIISSANRELTKRQYNNVASMLRYIDAELLSTIDDNSTSDLLEVRHNLIDCHNIKFVQYISRTVASPRLVDLRVKNRRRLSSLRCINL
jgi:hypothetical protein